MTAVRDFEDLAIFQKARELSKKIYEITEKEAKQRAKQVSLVKRVIDTYYPEAIVSPK